MCIRSATDFALKPSDCPDTEFPVRIADSDRGCLWYKKDNKFKIPKGKVCVCVCVCVCVWEREIVCVPALWASFGIQDVSITTLNIIKEELTLVCLCPPAAYIRFHIISPVIQQSAKKWVQAQMWPFEKNVCFLPAVLINISLSPATPLSPVSHSFNFIPFFIATIFPFTLPLTFRPSLL